MLNNLDKLRHKFSALYKKSREKKFKMFQDLTGLEPGAKILDIGFDVGEVNPFENLLEKQWGETYRIVAVTLGDPSEAKRNYPGVVFIRADGRALPFNENAFDAVYSNAVIEHVGSESDQQAFVEETVRVGRRGALTTPNYWFPIEVHTSLPLVHYLPWMIRKHIFRLLAGEENMNYMSRVRLLSVRSFRKLFPPYASLKVYRVKATFWPDASFASFEK